MYDLLIIGGGINGAGIARDAAGRGLKVLLCEKHDLAGATSSSSSKLVHGGLRYLESYEFALVRQALAEREVLLNIAPHLIWPLRFVLPVEVGMRPAWVLRLGLFLYDHLAKRSLLPGTRTLALRECLQGEPLQDRLTTAFEYSDCWADDARLVVLNAVDAAERGATIATRTECIALARSEKCWAATLRAADGSSRLVEARIVVNAAGPWVGVLLGKISQSSDRNSLRLVKGSHIIVKRLYEGEHAYILQSADRRVVFAIPYEQDYTLIGTTEEEWSLSRGEARISDAEADYLCAAINHSFKRHITREDVIHSYAGVRPLFDDKNLSASVVTRDYVFDLDAPNDRMAPVLSIFGGKLTTYRRLAEQAITKLSPYFEKLAPNWTYAAPLPGGDFPASHPAALSDELSHQYPWVPPAQLKRMTQAYGTRVPPILGGAHSLSELGRHFGAGLYENEVRYLRNTEFAQTADDILWRRSKLGLHMKSNEKLELQTWIEGQLSVAP